MYGALPPVFAGLPAQWQNEAASYLTPVTVEAGEAVMIEGEEDTTLAFVTGGTCEIWRGDVKIGNVGVREMIGEIELFGQIPRVCSITAANQVHLQVLSPEALSALSQSGNPVVYHLERAVVRRIGERIAKLNEGLAEYTKGIPFALHPKQPSFVDKLTAPFRKRPKPPEVDKAAILRASELFAWAEEAVVRDIAECFDVETFEPENVICQQGQEGDRMWFLVSGQVEILVLLPEDRAVHVARLGPGKAFGDAALSMGTVRSATCVSRGEVVALVMDRPRFLELYESDEQVGSAFRQGIIRNLILEFLPAMTRYAEVIAGATPADEGIYKGSPLNSLWRG